jgi:hypothetical protein
MSAYLFPREDKRYALVELLDLGEVAPRCSSRRSVRVTARRVNVSKLWACRQHAGNFFRPETFTCRPPYPLAAPPIKRPAPLGHTRQAGHPTYGRRSIPLDMAAYSCVGASQATLR